MAGGFALLINSVSRAGLGGPLDDASGFIFYREVHGFLSASLRDYGVNLFERFVSWTGGVALTLLALWIFIQGYRIITGRSRESMTIFATEMMKAVLIVSVATGASLGAGNLHEWVSYDLGNLINRLGTGQSTDLFESVDRSLGYMQLAFGVIDGIQVGENRELQNLKDMNMVMVFVGSGIPAIVTGSLLLIYEIMAALTLGFSPLFVLCLLFPQTRQLFWGWLYYLLGTLFSLAVLSVMAALAMDMICAVAAAFWVGKFTGVNPEGVNSLALQQGGLGLLLTALIVTAPRIAAQFFKGMLAELTPFSAFGNKPTSAQATQMPSRTYASPHNSESERSYRTTQTHAHRVATPTSSPGQEDRVKPAEDSRSFLERYPNATVSLGGSGGSGDPLPVALRAVAASQPDSVRRFEADDIQITGRGDKYTSEEIASVKELVARDMNVMGHMLRRHGDEELLRKFKAMKIDLSLDDWNEKYAGSQNADAYAQAHFVGTRIEFNAECVQSARSMHYRVSQITHELRHLMEENNDMKARPSGTPGSSIEKDARKFTDEFMKKYWIPEYEFYGK